MLIIADDLSGAADCAIGFARAGHRTCVALQPGAVRAPGSIGVLAVDTDTRRLAPAEAAARVAASYSALKREGRGLYKKIDSTLRGNWAAEVARLVPLAGLAIVAPAHPALGRTVRDGRVFVHGEPLERTATWQLENGQRPAGIAMQLEEAGLAVATLQVEAEIDAPAALARRIGQLAAQRVDALVIGAESVAALRCLAGATLSMTRPMFWVGSGGLACEIAQLLPANRAHAVAVPARSSGPTLIAVGSLSAVTARQTASLARSDGIETIVVPAQVLRSGAAQDAWRTLQARIGKALGEDIDVLLRIGSDGRVDPAEGGLLCAALARLAGPHLGRIGGLIATGGETARAMLLEAGVDQLLVLDELEPGMVVSVPIGPDQSYHPRVVTKAGAFGSDETLLNARQSLRRARAVPPDAPHPNA